MVPRGACFVPHVSSHTPAHPGAARARNVVYWQPHLANKQKGPVVEQRNKTSEYWRRNVRYLVILLSIWALVSYGFSVLWVDALDQLRIGGFKLGFWFAQQGSMLVFVLLILVYVKLMNRLDREFDVSEDPATPPGSESKASAKGQQP